MRVESRPEAARSRSTLNHGAASARLRDGQVEVWHDLTVRGRKRQGCRVNPADPSLAARLATKSDHSPQDGTTWLTRQKRDILPTQSWVSARYFRIRSWRKRTPVPVVRITPVVLSSLMNRVRSLGSTP